MIKLKLDLAKITGAKVVQGKNKLPDGHFITYLDITNAKLFVGKAGKDGHVPYYLDLVMMESKQSSYGDWRDDQTHMIVEDKTKEERAAGTRGAILGNASDMSKRRTNDRQPELPPVSAPTSPIDDTDCPF